MIAEKHIKPGESSAREVETIYELELNEILRHPEWNIARVPGGFMYYNSELCQFIPHEISGHQK